MTDPELRPLIWQIVQEGLAELDGEDRAWAEHRVIDPRPIEVALPDAASSTETMWLVTDFVDGDRKDYRLVYDPSLIMFGIIAPPHATSSHPVLLGVFGEFADTVRAR